MPFKTPEARKAYCKAYKQKKKEKAATCTEFAKADKEKMRCYNLRRHYGITSIEYDRILASQNKVCACCYTSNPGGPHNSFNVDHCHQTGKVRGLLCHSCNVGIGHLGDTFQSVSNAITYLSKSEPPLFPGIWKRVAPPILNTNLKFFDLEMQKDCLKNKLLKEMEDNADIVAVPQI